MNTGNLEGFLESVWEKRLWVLAWGAFLYCASFLFNSYYSLPEQLESIKKQELNNQLYQVDETVATAFFLELNESLKSTGTAMGHLNKVKESIKSGASKKSALTEPLKGIQEARRKLASTIGTVKGTSFQTSLYADFLKGYDEDLEGVDSLLSLINNFYVAYATGNRQDLVSKGNALVSYGKKIYEVQQSLEERLSTTISRRDAIAQEITILGEENKGKKGILGWKMLFAFLSLLYIEFFLFFGIRSWRRHRRKFAKGLNRYDRGIIKSLENFAEHTKSKKVWGLASIILAMCFWFVTDLVATSPEQVALIERTKAKYDVYAQDVKRLDAIWQKLHDWAIKNGDATSKLHRVFNAITNKQPIDSNTFSESYTALSKQRQDTAYFMGTVKGTAFQSALFSDILNGLEAALREYDSMLGTIERVYFLILTINIEGLQKMTDELAEMEIKSSSLVNTFQSRIRSIKDRIEAMANQLGLESEKEEAMLNRYLVKAAIFIPATLYQLVFVMIAVRTWRKHRRKELGEANMRRNKGKATSGSPSETLNAKQKGILKLFRYLGFWRR